MKEFIELYSIKLKYTIKHWKLDRARKKLDRIMKKVDKITKKVDAIANSEKENEEVRNND